jgi:glycine amidinotransferase/scyllo-inosamine-4-phosphate amidinotransferase 1
MATIHSFNEWESLRGVVVGSALGANWPSDLLKTQTTWQDTPMPQGPVPTWIIQETEQELTDICKILEDFEIEVHRPQAMDFVARDGMYNYCPRDRLLVVGETVVVPRMMMPCRNQEIESLDFVLQAAKNVLYMPDQPDMILDAANVARLDDTLLVLESQSGTPAAIEWLRTQFPNLTVESCNFYSGTHIDSTIVPLRPGLVMLNASRVTPNNCPEVFDNWEKIWIHDVEPRDFYQYPYASKWIGMNMLVIDPMCVMVDALQKDLIRTLESFKFNVIPINLTHSRTLGGGLHCVTLDLWRQHD